MRFTDRTDAGEQLADKLESFVDQECVVYALPRGGVVLGAIVAQRLSAPLDLLIPRKIGHPHQPELAIAAVTEYGLVVTTDSEQGVIDEQWLKAEIQAQQAEAQRRRLLYVGERPPVDAAGKTALIVDDGVATGLTMKAAIKDLFRQSPAQILIAVPVIPSDVADELEHMVDQIVFLTAPEQYAGAVSAYYDTFEQVDDSEVIATLERMDTLE